MSIQLSVLAKIDTNALRVRLNAMQQLAEVLAALEAGKGDVYRFNINAGYEGDESSLDIDISINKTNAMMIVDLLLNAMREHCLALSAWGINIDPISVTLPGVDGMNTFHSMRPV